MWFLLILLLGASAQTIQQTTVNYHLGTSATNVYNVPFTYLRQDNVTTVSWPRFVVVTDASGVGTTDASDTIPSGYAPANWYLTPVESVVRYSVNVTWNDAARAVFGGSKVFSFQPINSGFVAGVYNVIRPGSLTYSNADVAASQLSTSTTTAIASTVSSATTTAAASTSAGATGNGATGNGATTGTTGVTTGVTNPSSEGACLIPSLMLVAMLSLRVALMLS